MMRLITVFCMALLMATAVEARIASYQFDDPVKEARFNRLSQEIRCLVCQNQNIADSNADLAQDLRREVYGMVKSGMADEEIIEFLVSRYGDFVLYRPPVKDTTLMLWIGPLLMFLVAVVVLVKLARGRGKEASEAELNPDELSRLHHLIDNNKDANS